MNRSLVGSVKSLASGLSLGLMFLVGLGAPTPVAAEDSLVVRGEKVYPVSGPMIEDGVVVIRDGKITAVGPASEIEVPGNLPSYSASVVTPGLVDARTVVGLAGYLNTRHDQDQLEGSEPLQPELRAIDAYDARAPLVGFLRSFGVTTIHTGHGPGALVSGQTMIAKTRGNTVEEAVLVPTAMIAATLGEGAVVEGGKSPGNRSKAVAMLRAELIQAQEYLDKLARAEAGQEEQKASRKPKKQDESRGAMTPDRNLRLEALGQVLKGKLPLLVSVHRHQDISSALRLQREFGFRLVLEGVAEAYLLLEEIRAAQVPIILHPTMSRSRGEAENLSRATASKLQETGIPFAFESGYESYVPKTRVVLYEAAIAAAHGLSFDATLEALTLGGARILGLDNRLGSLEVGKDADLALYDGDPFEYTSHCIGVIIDGVVVSEEVR